MRCTSTIRLVLFVILLIVTGKLKASPTDTINIPEVVVTANKIQELRDNSSFSIVGCKRGEILSMSPMSLPDAVGQVAGVWMQKTNYGAGSPFIRGLTGYQTLIVIDGVRLNNATFRSGPNQYLATVDALMLQNIEVLKGSGSVQYGSDAIGGTICLYTIEPEFSNGGTKLGFEAYSKIVSSSMEKTGNISAKIADRNIAANIGFTYRNIGDIVAGGSIGKLSPTNYSEYAINAKIKYKTSDNSIFTLAVQRHVQKDVPLYHKVHLENYAYYKFSSQLRNLAYLKWDVKSDNKLFNKINVTLSVQQSIEERLKRKNDSNFSNNEIDDVKTFGFTAENTTIINSFWKTLTGVEVYYDYVNSVAYKNDILNVTKLKLRGLYPDNSNMSSSALFSLHKFNLNRVQIDAGLRYGFFAINVSDSTFGNPTIKPDALTGLLGASYKFSKNYTLAFNVNSTFRAPNINDVASFGIADYRYEVPNINLHPEKSLNKEIILRYSADGIRLAISAYHNNLTDLITNVKSTYNGLDSIDGFKIYKRENSQKAVIKGLEFEFEYLASKKVEIYSNFTYTHGQNISKNEPLRRIPPFFATFSINYRPIKNLIFETKVSAAAKQTRLSSGDLADNRINNSGTPGWICADFKTTYNYNFFTISGGVGNVFNSAYRIHGSGVDAIGRHFYLSLIVSPDLFKL